MLGIRKIQRFGWVPDLPDLRDWKFLRPATPLPNTVDLRPLCPPVYDQGQLGSCTANGIAFAMQFERMRLGLPAMMPSRLFIYYNERVVEGTVASDSGAQIRDGIKVVASQGACSEAEWPYDVAQFATKPPPGDYADALSDLALRYESIDNTQVDDIRASLAAQRPVVLGFTVYESFESDAVAASGVVPMPGTDEQALGGHCVAAVGYNHAARTFLGRNSWGNGWGMGGCFTIPYDYLSNSDLSDDFWSISLVGA